MAQKRQPKPDASATRTAVPADLPAEVFGAQINTHLIYEAVRAYRATGRRGTHMTKNRALVSGTGRKPWRQKGTGRARVGEARNPLWRHGGTVFGPQPRDYSYSMPKAARQAALRAALSMRAADGAVRVVDNFNLDAPRTKILNQLLDSLGVEGKALLLDVRPHPALLLAGRNLPGVNVVDTQHLTVYDVLDCGTLLITQGAIGALKERLAS
jgi:large subunit ribosomal protein L4